MLAVVVGLGAAIVGTIMTTDEVTRQLIYLLTAHMLLMVITGVMVGGLQGLEELRSVAVVDALSKGLLVGLVALFLVNDMGVLGVAYAYIISDLFGIGCYLIGLRRVKGLSGPVQTEDLAVADRRRRTLLDLGSRPADVRSRRRSHPGDVRPRRRVGLVPRRVSPDRYSVVRARGSDDRRVSRAIGIRSQPAVFNNIARKAVHVAALSTIPLALGLMVLADQVIVFLGYPEEFVNSVIPIMILAVSLPMVALNMIVGSALNAQDRQRQWALTGVAAAVLNLGLNFILIPYTQSTYGNGAIGAATVTSVTEVFMFTVGQVLLPRSVLDRHTYVGVAKCLGVGLVMAGVVWMARGLPIFVSIPLGAIVYVAGSLLLGTVTQHDLSRIRTHLITRRSPATLAA